MASRDTAAEHGDQRANVTSAVRDHYSAAAARVREAVTASRPPSGCGCGCGDGCTGGSGFGSTVYAADDLEELPAGAVIGSLGCSNPTALADLHEGETVLDLGSGGGIDVLLAARRVGPAGKAYGLDMTDEMLALARENGSAAGVTNAEFLKGHIEAVPLPDHSVDAVISNCVINLSPDKDAVLAEAFRVLRPGGRLAIADVVIRDPQPGEPEIPAGLRRDLALWSGCVGGALVIGEYRRKLSTVGFESIEIAEVAEVHSYTLHDLGLAAGDGLDGASAARFVSAFVHARKPV
ncbi:MAG: arsenite methyltransferase [Clostridia bacterium]